VKQVLDGTRTVPLSTKQEWDRQIHHA